MTRTSARWASRSEPAEASLRLSYDLLSPDLQALWRQLSVFPADFDWEAAAAVWELEREPAEDALDALARRSLILLGPVSDHARAGEDAVRYALHDLARLWAAEQATADERAAAAYRHAAHYERVNRLGNDLYLQGGENILQSLVLFDSEWSNIQAGFAWATMHTDTDDNAARLCSAYPAWLFLLDLRLHPRERIRWLEAALRAARTLGDRSIEGVHLGNLGLAYAALGDARRAIEFYEQQLVIVREIGDRRGEGNALMNIGNAHYFLGDARLAVQQHEQALEVFREIGDRRGEGNALGNLGLAYADLGDARRAIDFYEQRIEIAREIGDRRGEGNALANMGQAYKTLGEPEQARELWQQALAIFEAIEDPHADWVRNWLSALEGNAPPP